MSNKNKKYVIKINEMHKWFGSFHVLKNINLEVGQGERIVICGPSGSGKSTLIRCINRLEIHQQGHISVNGIELSGDLSGLLHLAQLKDRTLQVAAARFADQLSQTFFSKFDTN